MRLSLSPLSGKPAVIWAVSWFSLATIVTFSLWQPLFQWIPFAAYFAATALIAARTGGRMGFISAFGAVAIMIFAGYFAPGQVIIRSASILLNSALVIWLGAKLRREFKENAQYQMGVNEAVSDFVWMMTPAAELIFLNQRGLDYLGRSVAQLQRDGWDNMIHEEDLPVIKRAFDLAMQAGASEGCDVRLRRHDGSFYWFYVRVAPVLNDRGELVRLFGTSTNIEDRKRIEFEREQILSGERAARTQAEQANRTKDEFLSTLSHELRTPLNAIMGWIYIVRNERLVGPELDEAMEIVNRNAHAQLRLIEDLLEMSRVITGKVRLHVQNVDLAAVIQAATEAVQMTAEAKSIGIRTVLDPRAGLVRGDPDRLQQVMWNLLNNAIKFTPKGGKVDITLGRVGSCAEITVSDSGIGIDAALMPHIFERFRQGDSSSTRSYEGLGLGLAIVKELVELQGGTVTAVSAGANQGTTFRVMLPFPAARASEPAPVAPPVQIEELPSKQDPALELQSLRLLVVDDDEDARGLIARILQRQGAEVITAPSTQEALERLKATRFHTLISDIGMPGLDGCELIRQVRKLDSEINGRIPAIALTAFARNEERLRAIQAGFDAFLSKPVDAAELIAMVGRCASRAGASSAS